MGNGGYSPPSDLVRHVLEFLPITYKSVIAFASVHSTHRADVQKYSAWLTERLKDEPSPLPVHVWIKLFVHATHVRLACHPSLDSHVDVSDLTGLQSLSFKLFLEPRMTVSGLRSLTQLSELCISRSTTLTDGDVQGLTRLKSLEMINCANVKNLSTLTALTRLNMNFCSNLTGLEHCTNLTRLSMDSSTMPSYNFLTELQRLTHLDARGCRITDAQLRVLPSLTHLNVMCTDLTQLDALTNLTSLNMDSCEHITRLNLVGLRQLDMSECNLSNDALRQLTALTSLNMSGCAQITDEGIRDLSQLQMLNMYRSRVTDAGLQRLTRLTHLYIGFNTRITDEGIQNLKSLQQLGMRQCMNITDAGIAHLTQLTRLDMASSNLTDVGIAHLTQLTRLDMAKSKLVTDAGLQRLTRLTHLSMKFAVQITNEGIRTLTLLQHLNMESCAQITDEGVLNLKNLRTLCVGNDVLGRDTRVTHAVRRKYNYPSECNHIVWRYSFM